MPDVIINGPEGRIEARYHHSRSAASAMALVLHPHPQHGGTMNNKLVHALYQSFVRHGFSTLRFNFRGVGRSQGSFDRGEGELSDAASALDWLQTYNPNAGTCWVAGFSFGAWIGMQLLMRRPEIESFIAVAPPANIYDFTFLAPCPSSGLILQGDQDTVVPIELGAKARHQAVAPARHQDRFSQDRRRRSLFRRQPRHHHRPCRRLYPRPRPSRRQTPADARGRRARRSSLTALPALRADGSSGPRPANQSANGSRTSTVSSRSGLVESSATGASISSSSRRMYLIAVAGKSAQERAPRVLSRQPAALS